MKHIAQYNRHQLCSWINGKAHFNTLITLTLKQGLPCPETGFTSIRREHCAKTAWLFRDRFTRAILKSAAVRAGARLNLAAFYEGEFDHDKRHHLHLVTELPRDIDRLIHLPIQILKVKERLDWAHREFNVKEITRTPYAVIDYLLKEGTDAFLPEASSFTS